MDEDATDGELMARFYAGNDEAFNVIKRRWWKRLFGFFLKRGLSREDAEEGALESLVRLFLTRESLSFELDLPLGPFLFRTAYRLAIQEWRQKQRRCEPVGWSGCLDDWAATGPLPRATLENLSLCIRSLPEPEQTYLLLCRKHGVGDLEHQEIAAVLERSPARVTQISHNALESMRLCMSDKDVGPVGKPVHCARGAATQGKR